MKRRSARRWAASTVVLALASGIVWLNASQWPLRSNPMRPNAGTLVVDERLEVARRYAPFVYHEFHPTRGRMDVPVPVDFDGDLRGADNWSEFAHFELVPTLYYAVLETETHLFLSYHLYHPRDWTVLDVGLHFSHENDGENLQVVVDKAADQPVLLFTQAHYRGRAYAGDESGFAGAEEPVRGEFLTVDDEGLPDPEGRHACVFVESGGHGIHGVPDRAALVAIDPDGRARFRSSGWVLRPQHEGDVLREPALDSGVVVSYQLESITAKLWPLLARGELTGPGALLDGAWHYEDARVSIGVPRYYEADRFSGPFGPDRGISPFALDFDFEPGELGALFFDPARRYAERLVVPRPWSLEYVEYPFR